MYYNNIEQELKLLIEKKPENRAQLLTQSFGTSEVTTSATAGGHLKEESKFHFSILSNQVQQNIT